MPRSTTRLERREKQVDCCAPRRNLRSWSDRRMMCTTDRDSLSFSHATETLHARAPYKFVAVWNIECHINRAAHSPEFPRSFDDNLRWLRFQLLGSWSQTAENPANKYGKIQWEEKVVLLQQFDSSLFFFFLAQRLLFLYISILQYLHNECLWNRSEWWNAFRVN